MSTSSVFGRLAATRRRRLRAAWEGFWFTPESTAPVEVLRIAFGVVATLWTLSLGPVLMPFFGRRAAVPEAPELPPGAWTLLSLFHSPSVLWALWCAMLLAAVALTVGYHTRLAAVTVFVAMISVQRQAPAFNAGDVLLRILAFYLVLSPAGTAVSVDRWLSRPDRFWSFPVRAPWALRLVQIQLSALYLSAVWDKVQGVRWRDGSAVSYALRLGDLVRLPAPGFVTDSIVLAELMTFGTLAVELAIGVLVWNRTARPWVLGLGVLMHLAIELSLAVGFFGLAVLTLYLAFLSPGRAEMVLAAGRDRLGAWRERVHPRRRTSAQAGDGAPNPSSTPP